MNGKTELEKRIEKLLEERGECLWISCRNPATAESPYCYVHPAASWHYGGRGKNRKRIR